jgi:predicted N-formylglutamate amidohydrolase
MTTASLPTILTPDDGPAAEVFNAGGAAPICLVCEHASATIPASLGDLGLSGADRLSHAVWDIGAFALAQNLAKALSAPLVASCISRLVYDCNRPPDATDAIPQLVEAIEIPGNRDLNIGERAARVTEVYQPFSQLLASTLDAFATPPVLMTIHSFTPVWRGTRREVELGLLHDDDRRLAEKMLEAAPAGVDVRLNAPYSASDGVTHTLAVHAIPRRLQNVMIEVRNDLLGDARGISRWGAILADMLRHALTREVAT